MTRRDGELEEWETESLTWIHAVREKERLGRCAESPRPLPREEAERLAARYGLKLAKRTALN